jgi:hypothetical protein
MALDPSYDSKTIDELQAEFVVLGDQLSNVDMKRKDIFALIEKRKAAALAKNKINKLSLAEKEALREALGAA